MTEDDALQEKLRLAVKSDETIDRYKNNGLRLTAYYYSFEPTGVEAIDRILSAVAIAGKMYHHTDQWTDAPEAGEPSPIDVIQSAANAAAAKWAERNNQEEF